MKGKKSRNISLSLEKKRQIQSVAFSNWKNAMLFLLIVVLLMFYPGDTVYTNLFSHGLNLFRPEVRGKTYEVISAPYVLQGAPLPNLTADGVYVVDIDTATPLYKKNHKTPLLPASTTKVITALTALDVFEPEQVLEVKRVVGEGQSMGLLKGERITLENLLYGILVHSGNDAAYTIADNHPQGYDAFIVSMNEKAQALSMKETNCTNPAGFDEPGHISSAFDLSLAGRALLQNKMLSKIVSTKSITVSDVDFKYFHSLWNVNRLLGEIPGIGGLKTGYTEMARQNLITLYKNGDSTYLIVLLKSEDRFADTTEMVVWLQKNVQFASLSH